MVTAIHYQSDDRLLRATVTRNAERIEAVERELLCHGGDIGQLVHAVGERPVASAVLDQVNVLADRMAALERRLSKTEELTDQDRLIRQSGESEWKRRIEAVEKLVEEYADQDYSTLDVQIGLLADRVVAIDKQQDSNTFAKVGLEADIGTLFRRLAALEGRDKCWTDCGGASTRRKESRMASEEHLDMMARYYHSDMELARRNARAEAFQDALEAARLCRDQGFGSEAVEDEIVRLLDEAKGKLDG